MVTKVATNDMLAKTKWLRRVDQEVSRRVPSIRSTLRDKSVRDVAGSFDVRGQMLSAEFWYNECHIVGVYGPVETDQRLRARFVGARMRWDDQPDRFYSRTSVSVAHAAREIADFLRIGPGYPMNARENLRDAAHYLGELENYDVIVDQTRPRLNALTGLGLLDAYRRGFKNAVASLQNAANQLLETAHRVDYLDRFKKSGSLVILNALRNQDVHNIMVSMAIGTRVDSGGEVTFVTFDSSYLSALGQSMLLHLQWRVPSEPVAEALTALRSIMDEVPPL